MWSEKSMAALLLCLLQGWQWLADTGSSSCRHMYRQTWLLFRPFARSFEKVVAASGILFYTK